MAVGAGTVSISGGAISGSAGSGVEVDGGTVSISGCDLLLSNPMSNGCGGTSYSLTGTLQDGTPISTPASKCPPGVLILNNQPAQITCPGNQTAIATSGLGATVTYPAPILGASCPGTTVMRSPSSGSTFPLGTTTVTCTALDLNLNPSGSCSFTVTVLPSADLALSLGASPNPARNKQNLTYTIMVSNPAGPNTATGLVISDALPAGTTFVSAMTTAGTLSKPVVGTNGTLVCQVLSLPVGGSVKVTLTVAVNTKNTSISDTASVSAATMDPVPANNTATINVQVK